MSGCFRSLQEVPYTHGQGRGISESCGSKLYDLYVKAINDVKDSYCTCFVSLQNVGIDKGDIPDLTKVRVLKVYYLAISLYCLE